MEFRLLGEVELWSAGTQLDVGTPQLKVVLAALAVDVGRPVGIETLVDRIWDGIPPAQARNVLYSHLSRIRRLLTQATHASGAVTRIERRQAGYVLDIDPDLVDMHRFRRLVGQGSDERLGDTDRAAAVTEALALWRGQPLAGLAGRWVAQVRDHWHRQRLDAVVHWAQIQLRLGRPAAVITTLPDLVIEYPLVEPLEALLMQALHATERDAEALDRYATIRQRLADNLGADPGSELQSLHQAILCGELPPPRPTEQVVTPQRHAVSPAQLPPDLFGFTGRSNELRHLDGLIAEARTGSNAVVISAVSGTAGIGKTTLALHWAHRVRDDFPDGQLYVNLRGFDPTGSPVAPTEAVRGFLDAFEVPAERIPAGFDAQVALYRSLLANRRVLVVLDNARDAEQVRPLLPGTPGCVVVVTSRDQLTGLIAEGGHPLPLELLSAAEARALLTRRLGVGRIAAEPRAVDQIITLCARLPLALAIVAARAATHPGFDLAVLAGELCDARGGLDEFAGADPATDARAVFSWSYLRLAPETARLFRLLGLHPGPDISTPAAASLTGLDPRRLRPLLAELAQAHLIAEHSPGRYAFHDLLRAYATEQAHSIDTDEQRRAAIHRTLDHYLHTAHASDQLLHPLREPITLTPPQRGVTPEPLAHPSQAMAWFVKEHTVLLTALDHAGRTGWDTHTWQLAWSLADFLDWQGHWSDYAATQHTALAAARRLKVPSLQAGAHRILGRAHTHLSRFDDAHTHLQHALDLYERCGDRTGQAHTLHNLTFTLERQGLHTEALDHAHRALDLFQSIEHPHGQAEVLATVGWCYALLGNYRHALTFCQQGLSLLEELDNHRGQASTWDSLGYIHHHLGHHTQAISCYQHAIDLFRQLGVHTAEAIALACLGDTHHAAGDRDHARDAWQAALIILDRIDHRDAWDVRAKLATISPQPEMNP